MLFCRQEALEAVKKARKEAEEAVRLQMEADISRLKAEADAKVTELSTMLDQMQERVKAHDTKVDNEVCCTIFADSWVLVMFSRQVGTNRFLGLIVFWSYAGHCHWLNISAGVPAALVDIASVSQISTLQARKLRGLTDLAHLKAEFDKATQASATASTTASTRLASSRSLLAESARRLTGLQVYLCGCS